jgi:formate dehydrogenase subunit gamma
MPPPREPDHGSDRDGGHGHGHGHGRIERFTRAERYVHWATTVLMLALIATGAILYNDQLAVFTGHRQFITVAHVYCGFALPIPMAAGVFSRAYRADARRLNRHTEQDRLWLRRGAWRQGRVEEYGLKVGKFNAGQKLNSAFQCGAILVMAGTGTIMWFQNLTSVSTRTGATFVHDWLALAIGFVIIGHVWFAVLDRHARDGMRTGSVPRSWAEQEHPLWAREVAEQEARADPDGHR